MPTETRSRSVPSFAERSEATTQELIRAARALFAERGFAETSIEDVVRAAGVTRGALYHHFTSKTDVFRAVFEAEERELARRLAAAAARKRDPWKQLEAGCLEFVDVCLDPGHRRIVLIDGPAVLGWQAMREIEHRYTLALTRAGIEAAMEAGTIRRRPADPLAHLLFGALCEAAMMLARAGDASGSGDGDGSGSGDREGARRAVRREVKDLLAAIAA
jgi:AcrR family transcriptional regulator